MTDAPERIFICDAMNDYPDGHPERWAYGEWDLTDTYDCETPYIRTDIHDAMRAERDRLREIVCDLDEWADMHAVTAPEWRDKDRVKVYLSIGTLRQARAVLDQTGGEE